MDEQELRDYQPAFVVEDTFDITGRGLIVVSPPECGWKPWHRAQTVVLKLPDGSLIKADGYVEMGPQNMRGVISLNLPALSKAQVPIGTEVWGRKGSERAPDRRS